MKPQNFANHAHRPYLAAVLFALGLAVTAIFLRAFIRTPSAVTAGWVMVGVALLVTSAISRIYIVRLQDRIIRLEMQIRMAGLGRQGAFSRLTTPQLVALRFASDAELPALIDRALAENLTGTQIKQAVQQWQADYYRT